MMNQKILNKIYGKKMPWLTSFIALTACFLVCFYFVAVNAMATAGMVVFAGRIVMQMPLATCSNTYTCSACVACGTTSGCGTWDQWIFSPLFGTVAESSKTNVICQMPSFVPNGSKKFKVGDIVLGYAAVEVVATNDGTTANIWDVTQ